MLAFSRELELGNRGKTIFEQSLKDVKEKVTHDFSWIRDKALQGMGGRDYEDQTDLARCIEDVAKGILRKLGLPTETEANLDLDIGELPGDLVDLFWAIWDEATGMMIRGLNASPCCARKILHLARAVEQWHEAAGTNQLRRVALGSATGSSFTEMTEQGSFGTWTGDSVRNEGSAIVRTEQLDAIEEETSEESALLFWNEGEKGAIVKEIQGAAEAGEGLCPACLRVLQSEPGNSCERCLKVILPTSQPQTYSCFVCQWSICFDCRVTVEEQRHMDMDQLGGTRLHLAAREGDVLGLKSLLTPDTNINCRDFLGITPLHSLVSSPRCTLEAVGFLLHHGADIAAQASCNLTSLHFAARQGHKEVVDLLIQRGADVEARDKYNLTPLDRAAEGGHKEVADLLIRSVHLTRLQCLWDPVGYRAESESEFSPLFLAVLQGGEGKGPQMELSEKMAQLLIFAKHDPGCPNSRGITPLHWAAGYGKAPLVASMLHWTATGLFMRDATGKILSEEELQLASAVANVQDQNGRTALHRAVMHGHDEVVRWLVLMRADCNISDVHQSTPLHFAIHQNRAQLVRLLLEHKARVDWVDADDRLPLHLLAGARKQQGEEQMKILELLLQNPRSVVARDRDGWTPLHEASFAGNHLVLGFLLDSCAVAGGLVTESIPMVPGLLHLATMGKSIECVELLLKKQASPLQDCCLTWDKDNFSVQHHYDQVGLCLMKTGILPYPFDRIQFDAGGSKASFQRNVSTKMKEFFNDSRKSELKVYNSKLLQCDVICAKARGFDLRCVSPGEHKDDGSRRPLIVYKHKEPALHTRRVLEDIELWTWVQSRLADFDAGEEHLFRGLSDFQRKVVHQVDASFGLCSESPSQDVAVRKLLERSEPRRRPAQNDVDFLQEVGEDLDKLEPGQEVSLGYGLSNYRRKLLHQEVEKRSWSSRADGPNIIVRHPFPDETPSYDKKQTESEVEEWVRKELANLQLGESYWFSPELTSFQRWIVHKVAQDLGWAHESMDVDNPDSKVNKKGKASKGKGNGGGKGGSRQIIVTRREGEQTSQSLTKMQRSVVNHTARNFGLASSTVGDQREERRVVVKKSSPDNPSEAPVVHFTFQCDCCEGVPIGVRFHCSNCDDFDLCQSCYEKWTGLPHSENPIHPKDHCFEEVAFSVQPQKLIMATTITAFHFAAGMGLVDIVQAFLHEGDPSSLLQSATNRGDNALHLACQRRRWQVVNEVLKWNADCNQQNGKGRTALQAVSWLPSYKASDRQELAEMIQFLLSARGDPMIGKNNGDTPLHQADRVAIVFSLIYQNQY